MLNMINVLWHTFHLKYQVSKEKVEKRIGWVFNPVGHLTKTLLLLKHKHKLNNVPQIHYSFEMRQKRLQTNGREMSPAFIWMLSCQINNGPVLTSTLNGCSSPFTAHKIHSNNCKHNVPIQQLLRHLLLRTANKTIVNPAVVAYCLWAVLLTVGTNERTTGINPTRLAATLLMSPCLSCGAESDEEERESGEDSSTARAAILSPRFQ